MFIHSLHEALLLVLGVLIGFFVGYAAYIVKLKRYGLYDEACRRYDEREAQKKRR